LSTLPTGDQKIPAILPERGVFFWLAVSGKDKIHCDITGKIYSNILDFLEVSGFIRFYFMIGFIYEEIYDVLLRTQDPTSLPGSHTSCQEIGRSLLQKASITLQAPKNMAGNLPIAPTPKTAGKHTSVHIHFRILPIFLFLTFQFLEFFFDS